MRKWYLHGVYMVFTWGNPGGGPFGALVAPKAPPGGPLGAPRRAQERPRRDPDAGVPRVARRPKKVPHKALGGLKMDAPSHARRGNGQPESTFEINVQKVSRDNCRPDVHKDMSHTL